MNRDPAIITIAHRLSAVQNAGQIYTMDDGEVTETRTHTELLNNGRQYEELYTIEGLISS